MALVGAAGRLGIAAKAREVRGVHRVVDPATGRRSARCCGVMGAAATVTAWEELRARREVRATANRLVNFDDANLRRSAQAAVAEWLGSKYRVAPEPVAALVVEAYEVAPKVKLPAHLILAVMAIESSFHPYVQSHDHRLP